jgi:hypothetical protein
MNKEDEIYRKKLEELERRVASFERNASHKAESNSVWIPPMPTVEMRIDNRFEFARFINVEEPLLDATTFKFNFTGWNYHWSCDTFHTCFTIYNGGGYVTNTISGQTITWNTIESATLPAVGLPYWSKAPNYNSEPNSAQVPFGMGEVNGRICQVSSCVNCYGAAGTISFRWDSAAC